MKLAVKMVLCLVAKMAECLVEHLDGDLVVLLVSLRVVCLVVQWVDWKAVQMVHHLVEMLDKC